MDHWIDSAFSIGGFVGHLSYVLLVILMLMRDISLLRLLVIASALTGIAYDLFWLATGTARIVVSERDIAVLPAQHYVGEMSFLGNDTASATVTLCDPSRVWRIETRKIERLYEDRPTISGALKASFARDMRRKIVVSNIAASTRSAV